jgi:uncharacterized lipoprotein YbaY
MQAYKGVVRHGVVVLQEGAKLPEGAVVTVTVSEVELLRARMRLALIRNTPRRTRARVLTPDPLAL